MKSTLVALSLAAASALQPGSLRARASAHVTPRQPAVVATQAKGLCPAPKLGIIRLDYDYVADPGDIDYSGSFPYQVHLVG